MSIADESPLHDFPDRAFRRTLEHPDNLCAFLSRVVPELSERFDYERMEVLNRSFPLEDWRARESDVLIQLPYQSEKGEEGEALICALIEHQSSTDPRMPLRTLLYSTLFWEREWKSWEDAPAPRPRFELTPVLPIVLHTGPRPWGAHRQFRDLISGPEPFRAFAPVWEPLFWELSEQSVESLLQSTSEWLQAMAVVRSQQEDYPTFEAIYVEVLQKIGLLYERDRIRGTELGQMVMTYALWRRPIEDRATLLAITEFQQEESEWQREAAQMGKTIAQSLYEEGLIEGREEGAVMALQRVVLRTGRKVLGEPSKEVEATILSISDVNRLEQMAVQISELTSWEEVVNKGT